MLQSIIDGGTRPTRRTEYFSLITRGASIGQTLTQGNPGNPRSFAYQILAGSLKSQSFLLLRAANPGPRKIDIITPDVCSSVPGHGRRLTAPLGRTGKPDGAFRPLWRQQHQRVRELRLHNHSCPRPSPGEGLGEPQLPSVRLFICFLKHGATSRPTEPLANTARLLSPVPATFCSPLGSRPSYTTPISEDAWERPSRRCGCPRPGQAPGPGKQVSTNPDSSTAPRPPFSNPAWAGLELGYLPNVGLKPQGFLKKVALTHPVPRDSAGDPALASPSRGGNTPGAAAPG